MRRLHGGFGYREWHLPGRWTPRLDDNDHVLSLMDREVRLLEAWKRMPPPDGGHVTVFVLRSDDGAALPARAERLLSLAETERAARIRVEGARQEFTVGRAALRVLLGLATGCPPEAVPLRLSPFGKPFVPNVHSNVSHSRGLIYLALSRMAPVGIDVEWVDPALEALEIAQATFTPRETAQVAAGAEGEDRARCFCRLWTRKEAVAKADGRGLQIPLRDIPVPVLDGQPTWITSSGMSRESSVEGREKFFLHNVPAPPGYVAAVAVRGADFPITVVPCCDITNTLEVYRSGQTRDRNFPPGTRVV